MDEREHIGSALDAVRDRAGPGRPASTPSTDAGSTCEDDARRRNDDFTPFGGGDFHVSTGKAISA